MESTTLERMFDHWPGECGEVPTTAESDARLRRLASASRLESRGAALRLRVIAEIFEDRRAVLGEREDWAVDTWRAVGAEVAAALRVSLGKANSLMNYAVAMSRLPGVAAVFDAGDIDFHVYKTIVFRTHLITDASVMAQVDAELAALVARWPSMTDGSLKTRIDDIVIARDPDAVRRVRQRSTDCDVRFWENVEGYVEMTAVLTAADAAVVNKRLTAMATAVCDQDQRLVGQRRAAALGALGAGLDRMACGCGEPACPARQAPAGSVVIHVVADEASLQGAATTPGYLLDTGEVIAPELLVELAKSARQRPVVIPVETPAGPDYHPSRALADFVRARDLTCRAPGCAKPAMQCDIDHTIPWPSGATQAANLKCLCRDHHILKTFWGWKDHQLPDGTVIWTIPDDGTYVTTPGSILLFPALMTPTTPVARPVAPPPHTCTTRTAMMPTRRTTRRQNRAHHIATERARNRTERTPPAPASTAHNMNDDAPPF